MKKCILILTIVLFAVSCKKENEVEEKVAAVPVEKVTVERFDRIFYDSKPEELDAVKKRFPYFFPESDADTVWTNKIKNPLLQELHDEVPLIGFAGSPWTILCYGFSCRALRRPPPTPCPWSCSSSSRSGSPPSWRSAGASTRPPRATSTSPSPAA